jgi:hypothetical protein
VSELTYTVPLVGETDTSAEPKVGNALTEIKTVVNGKIGAVNLESEAVETTKLKNEAVTAVKLASNAVESAKVKEEAVTGTKVNKEVVRLLSTAKYTAKGGLETGKIEQTPSATRPTLVVLQCVLITKTSAILKVGAVEVTEVSNTGSETAAIPVTLLVPPGQAWEFAPSNVNNKVAVSNLTL